MGSSANLLTAPKSQVRPVPLLPTGCSSTLIFSPRKSMFAVFSFVEAGQLTPAVGGSPTDREQLDGQSAWKWVSALSLVPLYSMHTCSRTRAHSLLVCQICSLVY